MKGLVALGPDLRIFPCPALTIVLKAYPKQVMLCPIVYQNLSQSPTLGRPDGNRWVELEHHFGAVSIGCRTFAITLSPLALLLPFEPLRHLNHILF